MAVGFRKIRCHHIEKIRGNQLPVGRDGGERAIGHRGLTTVLA